MLAVLRKRSKAHLAILVNNLVYTISPSAPEMLGETKGLLEKFSTWWSRPVVTTESAWLLIHCQLEQTWHVGGCIFIQKSPANYLPKACNFLNVYNLSGCAQGGAWWKTEHLKTGWPRPVVHELVVFLQNRINVKVPSMNGGWFRTSDLQCRKLVFASVAGFWGGNAGKVKFMVIWPRGFGVAHALQAKTTPILKVSVLCPDWRYAKSL